MHACNRIFKFADDTYLVVPGVSTDTCQAEIEHLHTWATANNLQLNRETKEIVLSAGRNCVLPPPPCPDIKRLVCGFSVLL